MKRIAHYKKIFKIEGPLELAALKKTYRDLVKEWHPDKFQADDEKAKEADEMSREIIDAYHFLVSIAPETAAANLDEYNAMLAESSVIDFEHNKRVLTVHFKNGSSYEYFGVPDKMYSNLVNSPTQFRFAKRNIFHSFMYRKVKKSLKTD